ncbi:urea amidolyase family protein [Microbacterium aoyamense]|uniref:Urea amidolyase family protein n=1 Tax=Microbacterium aoyamense TaxID=344166 RepID=A0ABP5B6B3_9MICO|nr:5-oxoprolinase/urea amidolyase family protein [Microbacterium aoyamense]
MVIRPMGERAFLVEVGSLDAVLALHARLEASRPEGIVDLVPAARTVLVRVDPRVLPLAAAQAWALSAPEQDARREPGPLVEVDVAYDGPDLSDTAALLGVGADELVRRHQAAEWTVAFTGFAPGFGYLVSPDWPYDVPRLAQPRTRVPAGAVGLAAGFSGAYPRETPGGWRLIGTTSAMVFDPDAAAPALLAPGTRVRFRAGSEGLDSRRPALSQSERVDVPLDDRGSGSVPAGETERGIRIVEPGLLATLQDLGRPGAAALGVAVAGAFDRRALRTANRLLGNPEDAAAIEVTLGGLRALAAEDTWFAVTGAWGRIVLDGRVVDPYEAHLWPAGAELHLDWFAQGARAYLAVRGGFTGRTVLGSLSTDLLAGIGPAALSAGATVPIGGPAIDPIPVTPVAPWGAPADDLELDLAPGPRADWFAASALSTLFESTWTVGAADRVGVRLDGPALERSNAGELPSEGMVAGAIQVPPDGRPVILCVDGPVTGGYPVIAVVTDAALDLLAQARPGARIRFRHARPSG